MVAGFDLGIRTETWEASGGFPRSKIEDEHEDWTLTNRVREVSSRVRYRRAPLVRYSNRKVAVHGILGVLRWYVRHDGPVATQVDCRRVSGDQRGKHVADGGDRNVDLTGRAHRDAHAVGHAEHVERPHDHADVFQALRDLATGEAVG